MLFDFSYNYYTSNHVNAIDLGLVRLDVVHTQGPGLVAVVHVLTLDHDHVHVLVVKVQEDIQSQPVGQDHR
jgi:hypothetical protein